MASSSPPRPDSATPRPSCTRWTVEPAKNCGTAASRSPASCRRMAGFREAARRFILVLMTALFMRSVSRLSTSLWLTLPLLAADLPPGSGKAETEKLCGTCHEIERSIAPRQDRAGWRETIDKMVNMGATGTPKEFELALDYLAKNY